MANPECYEVMVMCPYCAKIRWARLALGKGTLTCEQCGREYGVQVELKVTEYEMGTKP